MGAVEADVVAVDPLGEQNGVPVIGLGDEPEPFDGHKVTAAGKADANAVAAVGGVGEVPVGVDAGEAWVFDAVFLVGGERFAVAGGEPRFGPDGEVFTVCAVGGAEDAAPVGPVGAEHQHDAPVVETSCGRVVDGGDRVGNVLRGQDRVAWAAYDKVGGAAHCRGFVAGLRIVR